MIMRIAYVHVLSLVDTQARTSILPATILYYVSGRLAVSVQWIPHCL